jgi:lipopolysaccharide biosynthesis glycosyltransferase
MLVGIIVGTYSSLFIATPVLVDTISKEDKNKVEKHIKKFSIIFIKKKRDSTKVESFWSKVAYRLVSFFVLLLCKEFYPIYYSRVLRFYNAFVACTTVSYLVFFN